MRFDQRRSVITNDETKVFGIVIVDTFRVHVKEPSSAMAENAVANKKGPPLLAA